MMQPKAAGGQVEALTYMAEDAHTPRAGGWLHPALNKWICPPNI